MRVKVRESGDWFRGSPGEVEMKRQQKQTVRQPYGRYHSRQVAAEDAELTHVGPARVANTFAASGSQ